MTIITSFATEMKQEAGQWRSFFQNSRDRFTSYWIQYLVDYATDYDVLALDEENIRSAWVWAITEEREVEIGLAMEPLYYFYRTRGQLREGSEIFEMALSQLTTNENPLLNLSKTRIKLKSQMIAYQSWFCWNLSQYALAENLADQALALNQQVDDQQNLAFLLLIKGVVASYLHGNHDEARDLNQRSYEYYRELGHPRGIADSLHNLGVSFLFLEIHDRAMELFQEAMTVAEQHGYQDLRIRCISNLGIVFEALGQYSEAKVAYERCFALCEQAQYTLGMMISLSNLSELALRLGNYRKVMDLCHRQLALSRKIDKKLHIVIGLANLSCAQYLLDDFTSSWKNLREGLDIAVTISSKPSIALVIGQIARFLYRVAQLEASYILLTVIEPHIAFIQTFQGEPENLYEILEAKLSLEQRKTVQLAWQDKPLDEAVAIIKLAGNDYLTLGERLNDLQ